MWRTFGPEDFARLVFNHMKQTSNKNYTNKIVIDIATTKGCLIQFVSDNLSIWFDLIYDSKVQYDFGLYFG